jgi:hypothetical protein
MVHEKCQTLADESMSENTTKVKQPFSSIVRVKLTASQRSLTSRLLSQATTYTEKGTG